MSKYKSKEHQIRRVYEMLRKQGELVHKLQGEKNDGYRERNKVVSGLSMLFPSCLGKHEESDTTWHKEWMNIVYIELPTGQASWHLHDSDLFLFAHLKYDDEVVWDGHTTDEKYDRLLGLESK